MIITKIITVEILTMTYSDTQVTNEKRKRKTTFSDYASKDASSWCLRREQMILSSEQYFLILNYLREIQKNVDVHTCN